MMNSLIKVRLSEWAEWSKTENEAVLAKLLRNAVNEIERFEKIEAAASRIAEQTNAESAYALHDNLIVALESFKE